MEPTRSLPPGSTTALVLAGGAAVSLGAADWIWTRTSADESASVGLFLLGWTLLAGAAIVSTACLAGVLTRLGSAGRTEVLLLGASLPLVVATCVLHPLAGRGSG